MNKNLQSLVFLGCLLIVISTDPYSQLAQQVGSQCAQNSGAQFTYFLIDPWPPVLGQNIEYSYSVTFQQTVEMSYLSIGTNYNRQSWNYQNSPYPQTFSNGDTFGGGGNTSPGDIAGNYIKQYTIHDSQNQIVVCWQYSYSLF